MTRDDGPDQQPYPAEKARHGEIVLKKRWQRVAFIGGLAALIIAAIIVGIAA